MGESILWDRSSVTRLEKAKLLEVDPRPELGRRVFLVSWWNEEKNEFVRHWVNLGDDEVGSCDCEDYLWRGVECKHILAVQLKEEENEDSADQVHGEA